MATTTCATCETRVSIETCTKCSAPICEDCRVRCQVCKKVVCRDHFDITSGGRNLCDDCMEQRSIAKSLRRDRKEKKGREENKALSFEALNEELDGPEPAPTSFEAVSADAPEAEEQVHSEEEASPESSVYTPENETLRMPIDENRPILMGSTPKPTPLWVYAFPALIILAIAYWVITQLIDISQYF